MDQESRYILFGAGSCGRYVLAHLATKGITPVAFADNASEKWGIPINGVPVMSPQAAKALDPDATWVATCISAPAREIRAEIKVLGVRTIPLHDVLPCFHGQPPAHIRETLFPLMDYASKIEFNVQCIFRRDKDYDAQDLPSSCADIYFPDFITHLDSEHMLDAGACDGDTVKSFVAHWDRYAYISALEPDKRNFKKLSELCSSVNGLSAFPIAVSDTTCSMSFTSSGDASSHIDGNGRDWVDCLKLDDLLPDLSSPPTYMKFDVEGHEEAALWGARKIIKEHAPVLAICAYHKSEDLWSIPLLIHALNPDYKIFLRRYAEGSWELVYYGVPPDRIVPRIPASHESYSDNHEG